MTEALRIIHRVAHDFFYVVARFIEGDGFCVNRAFQRLLLVTPLGYAARACVICSGSQQRLIVG
jgi:hypothetical protein